jgi:hypothetical protein
VAVKNIGPDILTDIHVLGPLNTKKGHLICYLYVRLDVCISTCMCLCLATIT